MATLLQNLSVTTDPKAVSESILELIALPAGRRPMRTTAGLDLGMDELNRAAAPCQYERLQALGYTDTEILRKQGS